MNGDIDVDKLFDEADAEHKKRLEFEEKARERIKNPIVRSYQEFLDEEGHVKDKSPFYVVVHKSEIESNQERNEETRRRLLKELDFIEHNFEYTIAGPFERANVPKGRPIIVCGAYDAICVGQQHDLLIKGGYDAYISKEGTMPFTPNKPAFEQSTK